MKKRIIGTLRGEEGEGVGYSTSLTVVVRSDLGSVLGFRPLAIVLLFLV